MASIQHNGRNVRIGRNNLFYLCVLGVASAFVAFVAYFSRCLLCFGWKPCFTSARL